MSFVNVLANMDSIECAIPLCHNYNYNSRKLKICAILIIFFRLNHTAYYDTIPNNTYSLIVDIKSIYYKVRFVSAISVWKITSSCDCIVLCVTVCVPYCINSSFIKSVKSIGRHCNHAVMTKRTKEIGHVLPLGDVLKEDDQILHQWTIGGAHRWKIRRSRFGHNVSMFGTSFS